MKLKFIAEARVNGEVVFEKDSIHDVKPQTSANRWIIRGIAIPVEGEVEAEAKAEVVAEAKVEAPKVEEAVALEKTIESSPEQVDDKAVKSKSKAKNK